MGFADLAIPVNKSAPNSIVQLQASPGMVDFPHISTGSFIIDWITGIGGLPRGRITELHGMQSGGKTTCALMTIAECQSLGLGALFLDFENSIDPNYAVNQGVNLSPDLFAYSQPNSAEEGLRIAEHYMQKGKGMLGVVLTDSVAAMRTLQDVDHEVGETQIGTQASVISLALRQIKKTIADSNCAFVFINQMRDVVDISWAGQQRAKQGPQKTTPGGSALKFYADLRLEFIPTGQVKEEQDVLFGGDPKTGKGKVMVGQKARVTAVKNKCAAPWRSGEIYMPAGKGIDSTVPCVDLALKFNLLPTKGAYIYLQQPFCDDDRLEQTIQGKENLQAYFEQRPEKLQKLFEQVWHHLTTYKGV
jgi:recombination protein RecA